MLDNIDNIGVKKKKISGVGIDICDKAIKIAKKNAKKFGMQKKLTFIKSDWFRN